MEIRNIRAVAPFKGYVVAGIAFEEIGAETKLKFDKRSGPRCPHCHAKLPRNKVGRRAVMDCPMPHGSIVYLSFPTVQGRCRSCDRYATTCPREVHPECHATWRLMRQVSSWAGVATNTEVTAMFEIGDATVRRYDKIVLTEDTPPPCLDGVTKLLIDEKAVRRGQNYVTIILNGDTGELLHMHEGRKNECVESFPNSLSPTVFPRRAPDEQRAGIIAVGIDRSGAYQAAVEAWLPHADIVYDRLHLMMNVNQAVDDVRRSQCRAASKEDRQLIKGNRYLILSNQENLNTDGREKLDRLLETNEAISIAYILKEPFRVLFTYQRLGWAKRVLANWCKLALASGLAPFQRLVKREYAVLKQKLWAAEFLRLQGGMKPMVPLPIAPPLPRKKGVPQHHPLRPCSSHRHRHPVIPGDRAVQVPLAPRTQVRLPTGLDSRQQPDDDVAACSVMSATISSSSSEPTFGTERAAAFKRGTTSFTSIIPIVGLMVLVSFRCR